MSIYAPPPMNLAKGLIEGLRILEIHGIVECEGGHVPDIWPNGTPRHPKGIFLQIMPRDEVHGPSESELRKLGWFDEQEGTYWLLRTS